MVKRSILIGIATVALLAVTARAHEPWPLEPIYGFVDWGDPIEVTVCECVVVLHPVRFIEVECECRIDLEQESLTMYEGSCWIRVVTNCPLWLRADIQDNGTVPGTYETRITDPDGYYADTPWGDPVEMDMDPIVGGVHPSTDPKELTLWARITDANPIDISLIPYCQDTVVATVTVTVQPKP